MTTNVTEAVSSKREERRFAMRLVLLLIVVVAGFFALILLRENITASSKYPRVKLPDGSWLIVRQVSTGKNHAIEIPYPLKTQFRRWQRTFKQPHTTGEDRTVIWLTRENDQGDRLDLNWLKRVEIDVGDPRPIKPKQYHRQSIQFNSSSGSGASTEGFSDAKQFATGPVMEVALIHFDAPLLRPRDQKLVIHVFDAKDDSPLVSLPIPYPAPLHLSTEQWQPDPLPASRADGNLTVTLNGVEFYETSNTDGLYVRPLLTFAYDGEPSVTWASSDEYHDLLGNRSYSWGCELSPSEPAWKLSLRMTQLPNGRFLPEETLKLPLRPITAARQLDVKSEKHTVNGVMVSLVGSGGEGPTDFTLPNSRSHFKTSAYRPGQQGYGMSSTCTNNACDVNFASGFPFLITADRGSQPDSSVQFVFRDQNGEELQQRGSSGTEGLMFWFFEPKPTSTSVEIEIIVQKYRHAEFLIAPPKPDQIKKNQ